MINKEKIILKRVNSVLKRKYETSVNQLLKEYEELAKVKKERGFTIGDQIYDSSSNDYLIITRILDKQKTGYDAVAKNSSLVEYFVDFDDEYYQKVK